MNQSPPSEVDLVVVDGLRGTTYPITPDTIVKIELDPDDEAKGDFAILDDGVEMVIDSSTIELVTHHFPDIPVKERFKFSRFNKRSN